MNDNMPAQCVEKAESATDRATKSADEKEMSNSYKLAPLRERDRNRPNPPPTSGPEIDDLMPPRRGNTPVAGNGVDDGLLPPKIPDGRPPSPIPDPKDFDIDFPPEGQDFPDQVPTPDVNVYQQKKTLAQGMMDLALLSANANQLRYVLESGRKHPYYYPSLAFISISLIMQIAVGVGLILNSRYNVKRHDDMCRANRLNNFTVIGIFIVTITNVFISAFGVAEPVVESNI